MVKKNKGEKSSLQGFVFLGLIILLTGFAFAEIWWTGIFGSPSSVYSVNENTAYTYNFTVNNTYSSTNITQINITLPGVFTFAGNTNFTNCSNIYINFTNYTGNLISWYNFTAGVVNSTASMNCSFIFNATTTLSATYPPGNYTITVAQQLNNSMIVTSYLYVQVNDTTLPAVTWGVGSPNNYSNITSANIYLNVSITETFPKNITFRLYMFNHSLINSTTYSLSSATTNNTINWTGLYKYNSMFFNATFTNTTGMNRTSFLFNVTVCDTSNNCGNTSFPITQNVSLNDTLPPAVTINRPVSYGNYSGTINISVTIFDHFVINATAINFSIFNIYGKVNATYTATNYSTTGWNFTITINNDSNRFGDGRYNITINAKDQGRDGNGNVNASEMIYFTIDNTAPTITLTKTSSSSTSLTIRAVVNDPTSGIDTACTISRSGASVSATSAGGEKNEQTITESSLSCGSSYSYTLTCSDRAGNSKATTSSFSTDACSGNAGSGGGGGGGGISISNAARLSPAETVTWTATYMPTEAEVSAGYVKDLSAEGRVSFKVDTEEHYVGIVSLTTASAKVQVSSTSPIDFELAVGEDEKVDLNNDGYYEVYVKLNSITDSKGNLFVQTIHELVPAEEVAVEEEIVTEEEVPTEVAKASNLWIIIIAVIVLIVIILYITVKVKKKKRYSVFGY